MEEKILCRVMNKEKGKTAKAVSDHLSVEARVTFWRHPLKTAFYVVAELRKNLAEFTETTMNGPSSTRNIIVVHLSILLLIYFCFEGVHQEYINRLKIMWCLWWLCMGFVQGTPLSCGLPTFYLFLFPHIVRVTLAVSVCRSVNFKEPPFPLALRCGDKQQPSERQFYRVLAKVSLETIFWGLGTAMTDLRIYNSTMKTFQCRSATTKDFIEGVVDLSISERWPASLRRAVLALHLRFNTIIKAKGFLGHLLISSVPHPVSVITTALAVINGMSARLFLLSTIVGKVVIRSALIYPTVIIVVTQGIYENKLLYRIIRHISPSLASDHCIFGRILRHMDPSSSSADPEISQLFHFVQRLVIFVSIVPLFDYIAHEHQRRLKSMEMTKQSKGK